MYTRGGTDARRIIESTEESFERAADSAAAVYRSRRTGHLLIKTKRASRPGCVVAPSRAFSFVAHRVQHSHCSSTFFHRILLAHAFALAASQFVHKKKSLRICTSMHSGGLELTKLTIGIASTRTTCYATGATGFTRKYDLL